MNNTKIVIELYRLMEMRDYSLLEKLCNQGWDSDMIWLLYSTLATKAF